MKRFLLPGILILLGLWGGVSAFELTDWPYQDELQPEIEFWKKVLTVYTSDQVLIHDAKKPWILYKIVTFDSSVAPRARERRIGEVKKEIARTLRALARQRTRQSSRTLQPFENYILQLFGARVTASELRLAAKRVRAQQGMKDQFYQALSRAQLYLPYIRAVFRRYELPEELAYLAFIESGFNPLARSKVGAVGMWQFMRSTGRLYMKINRIVDERYDPIVSTRAAARLLKMNYQQVADWALAITAYNFGLAGIRRAVRKYGRDYLEIRRKFRHRRFGFASRNFYLEFLAVVDIMRHREQHFARIQPPEVSPTVQYRLKKPLKMTLLAQKLGIELDRLKKLNPAYRWRVWRGWLSVPVGYRINLPAEIDLAGLESYFHPLFTSGEFLAANHSVAIPPLAENRSERVEFVSNGPASPLWSEVAFASLEEQSNFPSSETELQKVSREHILAQLKERLAPTGNWVEVFANETLDHYSRWLQVSPRVLRKLNGFGRHWKIYPGEKIRLDFRYVDQQTFLRHRIQYHAGLLQQFLQNRQEIALVPYRVKSGDTILQIAENVFRIPVNFVLYFNLRMDYDYLRPGMVVLIPVATKN